MERASFLCFTIKAVDVADPGDIIGANNNNLPW
jgi:hypothetical protein